MFTTCLHFTHTCIEESQVSRKGSGPCYYPLRPSVLHASLGFSLSIARQADLSHKGLRPGSTVLLKFNVAFTCTCRLQAVLKIANIGV